MTRNPNRYLLFRSRPRHSAFGNGFCWHSLQNFGNGYCLQNYCARGNAVTLMTVHLAKGLEFNNVFVTGLEENLFPICKDNEDELEEERRLCYVAMTRAREKLFLTYAQSRRKFGQRQDNLPSRFLFESGLLDESEVRESTQPRYTDYHSKYGLYGAGAHRPLCTGHGRHAPLEKAGLTTALPLPEPHKKERYHADFQHPDPSEGRIFPGVSFVRSIRS